jgi:uncharacterized protein
VFSQKGKFAGELSKEKFNRLQALLVEGYFSVSAELHFSIGDRGHKMIEGAVEAQVSVACQRCLKPLELTLVDDIRLALVQDEEAAAKLDGEIEPWIEAEYRLDPANIVEEQLLLAMPLAAYHDQDECQIELPSSNADEAPSAEREPNPFAILKELKK